MAIMKLVVFMAPYFLNFFLNAEGFGKYYKIKKIIPNLLQLKKIEIRPIKAILSEQRKRTASPRS